MQLLLGHRGNQGSYQISYADIIHISGISNHAFNLVKTFIFKLKLNTNDMENRWFKYSY